MYIETTTCCEEPTFNLFTLFPNWLLYDVLQLEIGTRLTDTFHYFLTSVTKIYTLIIAMIFIISILRAGINKERVRLFLSGKRRGIGYFVASVFGAITPFCSCSSIPIFLAFTKSKIPLGITISFLITSPMINEVAVVLLGSMLGIKFMVIYIITGILAGVLGGLFIDFIGAEKYLTSLCDDIEDEILDKSYSPNNKISFRQRVEFGKRQVKNIFRKIWLWVLIGVGVGAVIKGFLPEDFIARIIGQNSYLSVPIAVLVGIPLYANASGVIPIAETLINKGLPIGTTMAFMMSVVAASFPEFILLKQVMKVRLLLIFFLMLLVFFTFAGLLFNLIL